MNHGTNADVIWASSNDDPCTAEPAVAGSMPRGWLTPVPSSDACGGPKAARITRRLAMGVIGLALSPGLGSIRQALAQSETPTQTLAGDRAVAFVLSTSSQLVAIVNNMDPPAEKRRRLTQVIDATVDVGDIARFCLGRFWRLATPDQRQDYLLLFHDLLVTKIAGHLGEYRGVRVTVGLARATPDTEVVVTRVEQPESQEMQVDWVVSTASGNLKIIDLLAEGTSMRLTEASDMTAYLARRQYNIHELNEGIRQLIAQGKQN
jgi:phospholipid transport system substrate-binding protein